jgi:hypothetical protein
VLSVATYPVSQIGPLRVSCNFPKSRLFGKYTRTMTEPQNLDVSIGRRAKQLGVPFQLLTKLTIWVLEIVTGALGTCLIMVVMAFLEFRHDVPPLHDDLTLSKVVGFTFFILFEFALTGYLVTTLISRFALRGRLQRFYPYVCAGLYLLHSTIFFVAAGNTLLRRDDLVIQIGGACLTLACTWAGNRLIDHWSEGGRI